MNGEGTWTVLGTAVAGPWRGIGMRTTVFIDASGTMIDTHTGALTGTQLERAIEESSGVTAS